MKAYAKRIIICFLALALLLSMVPSNALKVRAEEYALSGFEGLKLSILGDSISTYQNWSNGTAAQTTNSTITNGAVYYPRSGFSVTPADTWWHQTADILGMDILVNNSWSGSCMLNTRSGTAGAFIDRCVQLHDDTGDNTGEEPDIIAIFLGTNDYYNFASTLGNYEDIAFDSLISGGENTYTYATPATCMEAYAISLHKISQRYPNAEVYCFTLFPKLNAQPSDLVTFNENIAQPAAHYGAHVVDLYNCGVRCDSTSFYKLMGDSLHPDAEGMDAMTNAFLSSILKNSKYMPDNATVYDIAWSLTDVVAMQGTSKAALGGAAYEVELEPISSSCEVNLTVTVGGADITESCCSGGAISIPEVTGNVTITATAVERPEEAPVIDRELTSFRWELRDNTLVSVTSDGNTANSLTRTHGTVTDGVQSAARYTLDQPIELHHDRPWVVERKSEGNWSNSMQGGLLFAENSSSRTEGYYFYRRSDTTPKGLFALGEYKSGTWYNYGITLPEHGIDDAALHTYRMVNRIAEDGTNMVCLYVDGEEVGPLNGYNVNGTNKGTTDNWVSGKDFTFSYLGTDVHTLNNCTIHYIQVWEDGEPDYTDKVVSIMGDSISTFAGYIPVADGFNREHLARYPQDNLLTDVNETWWMQVIAQLDAKLGINDSWRGATVSGAHPVTTGDTGENASMANLTRIRNLGTNGTPDVILFYGGTNDLAHVSKVGTFDPATAPTQADLTTAKWDNLADGYVHTLLRMKHYYPDTLIVALLPTYTADYYSDDKLAQGNAVLARICAHYNIPYIDLRDSGVTADHLPDGIHPGEAGMDLITAAVIGKLNQCQMETGSHTVYSVSHSLTNVTASLGHYQGIDAGNPFEETLSGSNITVTVTMGGTDITAQCYQGGKITIAAVTGNVTITAKAGFSLGDRLQQRPEHCCGVNLWAVLKHDTEYYTAGGWGIHATGKVRSVTFPVMPGEKITASSFGAKGTNGATIDGIRVTYFSGEGLLKTMSADAVYNEFSKNGYLTVPEEAMAISIPMWTPDESWEIYILNPERKFCIDGANMTLAGSLEMNFFIEPSALEEGESYYAVIRKEYADDRGTATKRVEQADWSWHNGYRQYYVTFDDVAAKEMTDRLTVVVYNSEDEAVSHVWTDSVRDYAMRMLKKEEAKQQPNAEKLALYVDMLNYGAAAQSYFNGYHKDDLANSALSETQQRYSIGAVDVADNRVKGEGYSATNLTLESEITMNFFFLSSHIDQSMYAIAEFTDHYGHEKTVRIEGSQFRQLKNDTDWYVPVAGMVVADFRQCVTVTVYHADGTVSATAADRIESYVARMKTCNSLYDAIIRFCAAAHTTFH